MSVCVSFCVRPSEDRTALLNYAAYFYGNFSNYLSFGDTKFVPRIPLDSFRSLVSQTGEEKLLSLFDSVAERMYSLAPNRLSLGFAPESTTTYYTEDMTKSDAEKVEEVLATVKISPLNTRVIRKGEKEFEVKVASAETRKEIVAEKDGVKVVVTFGDFADIMKVCAHETAEAAKYSS